MKIKSNFRAELLSPALFMAAAVLLLFFCLGKVYAQSPSSGLQLEGSDDRAMPLIVGRGIGPNDGIPMNPTYRVYLQDVKGASNFYTTKEAVESGGDIWVAYEISGVTLTDDLNGGVDLDVALWGENESVAPPEKISFGIYKMTDEVYRVGQSSAIKHAFKTENNFDLAKNAKEIFGADGFEKLMSRLDDKKSYKRAVVVRKYTPKPGLKLGFLVGFGKGDNFAPLIVRLSAFRSEEDLLRVFNKNPEGAYVYPEVKPDSWFKSNKGLLILIVCIAAFFGARAVIARRV